MNTKKVHPVKSSKAGIRAERIISQGKKVIKKNVKIAKKKGDDLQKIAVKEYAKIKKEMDTATKKLGGYVKKNPEKAALISAGIGAAIGAAVSGILVGAIKGKKKKDKNRLNFFAN